jgi:hypothetical protein
MEYSIRIRPKHILIVLLIIIALLALADIASQVSLILFDNDIQKFDVELENNIPTWFSSAILLIDALLFALIAAVKGSTKGRFALHWAGLAGLFLYMSADETASIHEMFILKGLPAVNINPDLWVLFAAPLVVGVGVLFFRFFLHLPARTRQLMLLAMGIYICGALVMEAIAINDVFTVYYRGYNVAYSLFTLFEEVMEMFGASLLIYALLAHIGHEFRTVRVQVDAVEPLAEGGAEKLIPNPKGTK